MALTSAVCLLQASCSSISSARSRGPSWRDPSRWVDRDPSQLAALATEQYVISTLSYAALCGSPRASMHCVRMP